MARASTLYGLLGVLALGGFGLSAGEAVLGRRFGPPTGTSRGKAARLSVYSVPGVGMSILSVHSTLYPLVPVHFN